MRANGVIIKEITHYKPYRWSTHCIGDKLIPWFKEYIRSDGGRNQFLDREFL